MYDLTTWLRIVFIVWNVTDGFDVNILAVCNSISSRRKLQFKILGKCFRVGFQVQTNIEFGSWGALNFSLTFSSRFVYFFHPIRKCFENTTNYM